MKKQLLKIEEIADKKAKEIEAGYFLKYKEFYKLAIDTIGDFKVLLYGGTAINDALPEKLKFYRNTELPDIDCFCTSETYKLLSLKLLKAFFLKGYKIITIREALHESTYKLMVEGLHVIDISIISEQLFNAVSKNKIKTSFKKIYSANIEYLKYSLHGLIAQPLQSHRWSKVFERMMALYKVYPNNTKNSYEIDEYFISDFPENISNDVNEYIKTTEFVSFGWDVISKYLNFTPIKNTTPVKYIVSYNDPSIVARNIVNYLKNKDISITINEEYTIICYKDIKFLYIFKSTDCSSYITLRGKRQASIHTLIQQLYVIYFLTNSETILRVTHDIVNLLLKNISSKKTLYDQFVIECYGDQRGIVTLRKDKFIRLQKKTKN